MEDKKEGKTPEGYQRKIEEIDDQILDLLYERQEVAASIGKLRIDQGIELLDTAGEQAELNRLTLKKRDDLGADDIHSVFSEILSASRSVQQRPVIAYLGPEGTFCNEAALNIYRRNASFMAGETIEDVFQMVENGTCSQGLVPIENSYEGSVARTLDLFFDYDLKIVAETYIRVRQHLLGMADALGKVTKVVSHPMAIAQCRSWLRKNLPQAVTREVESTAAAAKKVLDDPKCAAIGSSLAGDRYNLKVLGENIEDLSNNVTRFLVIGNSQSGQTGNDKTSLLFLLKHQPGTLHRALEVFSRRNVNLTRIESRPMKTRKWDYLFYIDLEGHEADSRLGDAIKEMEKYCQFLKRLGSYPAGMES